MVEGETKNSQDVTVKKEYRIINHIQKSQKAPSTQSELENLYIEREQLLSTGQYNERDALIINLNNKIKSLEN
jgi:hypothetical protein